MMQFLVDLFGAAMSYTALNHYVLVAVCLLVYYLIPKKGQWCVLLAASLAFYWFASRGSLPEILVFLSTILISYAGGLLIERFRDGKGGAWLFPLFALASVAPLLIIKGSDFLAAPPKDGASGLIVPLGVSFYSLQVYAYLSDVRHGRISAQRNPLRYALFISFFPGIVQGPISRYSQLSAQLFDGHRFDERQVVRGALLVLWGFFLKYMIADRAAVFVNAVFASPDMYRGAYVVAAGALYSIQLYADFLACVNLSIGVAEAFGIQLVNNFDHPYFARSIKDFWRRWHMSLSSWLRDYVYIPLGGNRKGRVRKYLNLLLVFLVSGLWHGSGVQFLAWGAIHAVYQIVGDITLPVRQLLKDLLGIRQDSRSDALFQRVCTFILVAFAWVLFRAESLEVGLDMLGSVFTTRNPWVFFNDALLQLGLDWKEWVVLGLSVATLYQAGRLQERMCVRDRILAQPLVYRWAFYVVAILIVIVFGTYGYGFNAADFIYGGF